MFKHFSNNTQDNDNKLKDIMDFLNRILPNYLASQFKLSIKQNRQLVKLKNNPKVKRLERTKYNI